MMSETLESKHPVLREKGRLMSASEIERTLVRLAHQIVEKTNGSESLALVGIMRRGDSAGRAAGHADRRHRQAAHSKPACSISAFTATT